jgi:hypothetical protein
MSDDVDTVRSGTISGMKTRQRVIDHGEVFTPPGLVNDMLDLVAHECERIDSRFLEPACGDGNFLAEVVRRRLAVVDRKRRRTSALWEQDALLGLACLYGIELLFDNVRTCRDRLIAVFVDAYAARFGARARGDCIDAARLIVRTNIFQGDALAMTTVGDAVHPARPLVFTEWSMLSGGLFKRRQFEYHQLVKPDADSSPALFGTGAEGHDSNHGEKVFIAKSIRDLPLIHYRALAKEGLR